ncbi:MAG TPA: glutamate mutase L [Herpetosiphonaceae bacterium]|nr:glutamate mutase L [Herpetosiphonaceae bacterium]
MAAEPHATLVAEVGTATTKLALVDLVDDVFRLIARVEASSTTAAPLADATHAILALARSLEEITGRRLCQDGRGLMAPDIHGNGVGTLVVTTSAAGSLPLLITALAAEQSARAARSAASGTYTDIEHIFALDEAATGGEHRLGEQVEALARAAPAAVLVAGGLEGGAVAPILRLAHLLALLARRWPSAPRVVYAGNSLAAERVQQVLAGVAQVDIVENVRPAAETNRLEPTRSALQAMYTEMCLPSLPGYGRLKEWGASHVGTVADDQAVAIRFLAERFGRNVLALDVGSAHSAGHVAADGHFSQVVLNRAGIGQGATLLGETLGMDAITRWLPFEIGDSEIGNRLLNRAIRPAPPPTTSEELLLDFALIRCAATLTMSALREARGEMQFDLMIAGGALARAPRPGLAALALLDTLAGEEQAHRRFAVDLYLDSLGLIAAGGALAHVHAGAAADLIEQDALNNGPLATVVAPDGTIEPGSAVLDVELTRSGGETQRASVSGGEILRLALPRGQRGTLRIRPAPGISIGDNAAGAEVLSDEAAIAGSALGIIIDARPRPLRLPEDAADRRTMLTRWLEALDALPSTAPGTTGPTTSDVEQTDPESEPAGPPAAEAVADVEMAEAPPTARGDGVDESVPVADDAGRAETVQAGADDAGAAEPVHAVEVNAGGTEPVYTVTGEAVVAEPVHTVADDASTVEPERAGVYEAGAVEPLQAAEERPEPAQQDSTPEDDRPAVSANQDEQPKPKRRFFRRS